jgi:hypothetical protein
MADELAGKDRAPVIRRLELPFNALRKSRKGLTDEQIAAEQAARKKAAELLYNSSAYDDG